MKTIIPSNRGLQILIYIDGEKVCGQKDAILNQTANFSDISNRIEKKWEKSIVAERSWNIKCNGLVIKNADSFKKMETAFLNGTPIAIVLMDDDKKFTGNALISSCPLTANYNDSFLYNITLTGTGELLFE